MLKYANSLKILKDTLQNEKGKYSRKSITALASFVCAVGYENVGMWFEKPTEPYVFNGLIMLCGVCLGLSVADKFRKI